ncbi:glycogen synthase [Fervidibacillus albus]|uniref:Glycogen synthase n=1 Tax=Fervidibacillus albus TaxID=2980026 RepID=A0A9E8LXA8_9BACI|nr:glycogen synthase [Fervidibacillus albus]WAA11167.1 glycogen synthase [Fervidibacillus albus]
MKNVMFVASECTPFIKTGGLGDVIGSLPQHLKENEGFDVRVILPLYDEIDGKWKEKMEPITSFDVRLGWRNQEAKLFQLDYHGIIYYFIANDYYFTRKGIYGYYDDGERFVFFSHAVIEALKQIDFKPDILHGHDWQTGVAIALSKITQPIEGLKTIFTIHNIKYQGVMPLSTFDDFFNLGPEHRGGMEWEGNLNCMKSALFHADKITTVSPTYAEEIKQPYFSEGLHPILLEREQDLVGIMNGVDTKEYNPLLDPHIYVQYRSARTKKAENKMAFQKEIGLPVGDVPMYIIISRLVEQKGFDLVKHIFDEFLQENIQFVILGTGDEAFEQFFTSRAEQYPEKVRAFITFDEVLSRKMYAAADFFVMPSRFEPCGLTPLIAFQYKTVPIVRETGGLNDSVKPFNEFTGEGNGFSFHNYNAHELLHVLRYSLSVINRPDVWKKLIRNVNKTQFSWKKSAQQYAKLYKAFDAVLA